MQRDSRPRKAGDERMALARRDAEHPGRCRPGHNGEQRRAKRNHCLVRVSAEINHVIDRHRHGAVDFCHNKHTEKIADRRHHHGSLRAHRSRRHAGCDGVRRIRPPIDEDDPDRQQRSDRQRRV